PATRAAYIIYTSGTTGSPKGVPTAHANLSPLLHWARGYLGLGTKDRLLQNMSYHFDFSVLELFTPLTSGASICVSPSELLLNHRDCIDIINREDITFFNATPSQYHYIASQEGRPAALRVLILGGETFTNDLRQRVLASVDAQCRIFNIYGPTETTILATIHEVQRKENKTRPLSSVPIGRVAANAGVLVLDNHLNLCPFNAMGELYILGDGVSKGYLNKPELTAGRFVNFKIQATNHKQITKDKIQITNKKQKANEPAKGQQSPLNKSFAELFQKRPPGGPPEATLYKTGDLVRWYADGAIEFLGRVDHQ
ncbi:MAG: amino acid adenylation domain-containing protein, partial [bacterium]|nr:amino acid adenylation domain-containing protein [bacterium]